MTSGRVWAIKGVSDRTRDAVLEAARAEALTIGEWVERALARAAEEALHPRPAAASREDVAQVVRELLDERLAPLVKRVNIKRSERNAFLHICFVHTVALRPEWSVYYVYNAICCFDVWY